MSASLLEHVREAAKAVAGRNGATRALLFGSHARGTATTRSDVDLVFVEETADRFLDRLDRYLGPMADALDMPVEVLVYTPAEYERMRDRPFLRRAEKEGIVLYES